jgi:hypothetical protein
VRRWLFLALLAACTASTKSSPDAAMQDAPDGGPGAPCPIDSALSICLSFDLPAFGTTLSNEGAIAITANLVNVSRTGLSPGAAALLTSSSTMTFPMNTQVTGIVAVDARLRLDQAIAVGMRVGIMDTEDADPAGMSVFLYEGGMTPPATHRIRCNIGGVDVYGDTSIALGTWFDVKCTCDNNVVAIYRDGAKLGELAGCTAAGGTTQGIQIGQNSRATAGLPPNEPFVGAIDRFRMWTTVP